MQKSKWIVLFFMSVYLFSCTSMSHIRKFSHSSIPYNKRQKIAIMDFQNKTGIEKNNVYIQAISQSLQANLFTTKAFRIIEREKLSSILKELSLSMQGFIKADSQNLKKIGEMLNADALLFGDLLSIQSSQNKQTIGIMWTEGQKIEVSVTARLVDIETGEVMANVKSTTYVKQRNWVAFWFARLGGKLNKEANITKAIELATQDLAQKIVQQVSEK